MIDVDVKRMIAAKCNSGAVSTEDCDREVIISMLYQLNRRQIS